MGGGGVTTYFPDVFSWSGSGSPYAYSATEGDDVEFTVTAINPNAGGNIPVLQVVDADLPPGVSAASTGSGVLSFSGTANSVGDFIVPVTADAGTAWTSTAQVVVDIGLGAPPPPPPAQPDTFTSSLGSGAPYTLTVLEGDTVSFTVTATNPNVGGSVPAITASGLPSGLVADPSVGVLTISGTAPVTTGDFSVTVTADAGTAWAATIDVVIQVESPPPPPPAQPDTFTTSLGSGAPYTVAVLAGDALTPFTVTATNPNPDIVPAIAASGLPSGLVADPNGGVLTISGTPDTTGDFTVTVTADANTAWAATVDVAIQVESPPPPPPPAQPDTFTSSVGAGGGPYAITALEGDAIGNPIGFTVTAANPNPGGAAPTMTVTGLPPGLAESQSGGVLTVTGTPSAGGTITIVADQGQAWSATTTVVLTVESTLAGQVGQPFSYTIPALPGTTAPIDIALLLPPGLSFDRTTLTISGTPTEPGLFGGSGGILIVLSNRGTFSVVILSISIGS